MGLQPIPRAMPEWTEMDLGIFYHRENQKLMEEQELTITFSAFQKPVLYIVKIN